MGLNQHATELIFLTPIPANKMEVLSYIVLRVMRLTYTRGLIRFSNCAGLSRLIVLCDHSRFAIILLRKVI